MAELDVDALRQWLAGHGAEGGGAMVLFYGAAAWVLFVGTMGALYLWVASRQVRPRRAPPALPSLPTSPTSKRKRHSKSFSDILELERELQEEKAAQDHLDWSALPATLQRQCDPEQCKLLYNTLSQVFSFLRRDYVESLASALKIRRFAAGEPVFDIGSHDGSILMVASGQASLVIHGDDGQQFSRKVSRGETISSSLSLLAALVDDSPEKPLVHKVMGRLSASALLDNTIVFEIPCAAVDEVVRRYPDSFLRLAQAAFNQVERVTVRSLVDHFGLTKSIVCSSQLVDKLKLRPFIGLNDIEPPKQLLDVILTSIGADSQSTSTTMEQYCSVVSAVKGDIFDERTYASSVHFLLSGKLSVQLQVHSVWCTTCEIEEGGEVGLVSSIIGHHVPIRFICETDAKLLAIPNSVFAQLLEHENVMKACISHLIRQCSPLVCITDSSFESIHIHSGESLFDRGDVCDSVFTVMSGRLRAIQVHRQKGKQVETTNELVRGATLGALDMLAAGRSNSTVFAVRDSQISRMPRAVFDFVISLYPTVLVHFTTSLAQRMSKHGHETSTEQNIKNRSRFLLSLSTPGKTPTDHSMDSALPLGTIAVISLTKMAKIQTFCKYLEAALKTIGTTEIVSSARASGTLGDECLGNSRLARANLSAWLGDVENSSDLVIYEADPQLTPWTDLCIRQADQILLLCSDTEPPQSFLQEIVKTLEKAWTRKNVSISVVRIRESNWTLAAVDAASRVAATESSRANALKRKLRLWKRSPILPKFLLPMEKYEWINGFHNVQTPFEDHQSDFLRLSRRITGRAVGLVLGGGGARGLAHIGVLKALEDCGVHVDVVGGTSIGAFIGAMYALHPQHLSLVESKVEHFSKSLSSVVEKLKDLTLPISSFFNGSRFNRSIQDHFFDLAIEDLMLNYFCVSTDIAKSRMSVHRSGLVWKYVRASMSLQGYLPPISEGGSLLLDGGYMNNLPADVMKEEGGIKYVLAVDVGSEPRREFFGYGTALSGWWLLWNKLNPFAQTVIVPSMGDVSAALAYVSSEQHKERMKAECIDLYLRPPVNDYGTLQFDKMEEIIQVGYDYALPRVRAWASRVLSAEPDADIVEPIHKAARQTSHVESDDEACDVEDVVEW